MPQPRTIRGMARPSPSHANDPLLVALGATIRRVRVTKGVSQEALAVDAEIDRSYMGGIERGQHNVTLASLHRISRALNTSPSSLLKSAGY